MSSTAIIFAPVGGDWTCRAFSQVRNHKLSPKIDTLSLPPSKAVWNLVLLCLIEHQKNHAVPNSACHPAAATSMHRNSPTHHTADRAPVATSNPNLTLTYRVLAGSASSYFTNLAWALVTPCSPCSTQEPHLAKPSVQAWQSKLFSYPYGGASWPLSEQGQPCFPSKSSWKHRSTESTCSPKAIYVSPPISTHLLSPPLIVIFLHRLEL